jgi:type II secretory pathway pseudopilin PulG
MTEKVSCFQIVRRFHSGEVGFTLIELMLVMIIIFALGGVAALGIIKFISGASEEMRSNEAYEIQQSVTAYIASGYTISRPFVVTPVNRGVLDPYIPGKLKDSWIVNADGKVERVENNGSPEILPQ